VTRPSIRFPQRYLGKSVSARNIISLPALKRRSCRVATGRNI
jgi:hypothetical protein